MCVNLKAQSPSLFLSNKDFQDRAEVAHHEPWAKASLQQLIHEADDFPASYEKRFGLSSVELPSQGGQWLHWYVCPDTGTPLQFRPPNHNVCPDTGKEYSGAPYDQVVYQLENDALHRAALTLGLAYRFTGQKRYAEEAVQILTAYADRYDTWALHDNHGNPTPNGAKAYSQTLDESIWLIDIAWTYDLVRGAGLIDENSKAHIENDLLRASYQTVSKAHKGPTNNIQSWINAAIAAVGFTLHDQNLIHEAIDGPIGFRYQMRNYVQEGFWIEGAFGYHFYALRALTATAQMAKQSGLNLWAEEPALLSLFTGPIGVLLPNGELPAFNDSGRTSLYGQDYLYELAYAASRDERLLPIMEKNGRTNREALLFGVEKVPVAQTLKLSSAVFPKAGYAALRNNENDLTVIAKFGQHGGGHGHYDKLSFVLYSQGRVMGDDPGTQLYGLPLHQQWDQMTIAHNTISVDEKRQAAATGKLIDWKVGADWVAVTMDAGSIYDDVSYQRSMVLTSAYCLIADHVRSLSSTSHSFDWMYHNEGSVKLEQPGGDEAVTGLPIGNGYGLLRDVRDAGSGKELRALFTNSLAGGDGENHTSNSSAATVRAGQAADMSSKVPLQSVLELVMPASTDQIFMHGMAPGHDLRRPVPFVLSRKKGADVTFTAVISPEMDLHVKDQSRSVKSTVEITGKHFSDDIELHDGSTPGISVQHEQNSLRKH
jgi:hypothetical protein